MTRVAMIIIKSKSNVITLVFIVKEKYLNK